MTLQPGIHFDIPENAYHADPCERPSLSVTVAKVLLERSPLHAARIHPRLTAGLNSLPDDSDDNDEPDDSNAVGMQRGALIHHLLLGGGADYVKVLKTDTKTGEVSEATDYKTPSSREFRDRLKARGQKPVLAKKLKSAQQIADRIRGKLDIPTKTEVTVVWESDGVLCRVRLDGFGTEFSSWRGWDLKTTDNAAAAASEHNILKYGYHIQRAAYMEGVETIYPSLAGRGKWEFAFAEASGACDVIVCDLPGELIELGRLQWARAKRLWAQCLAANEWPGYPKGKRVIEASGRTLALLAAEVGK
jgi:hypothetical protein